MKLLAITVVCAGLAVPASAQSVMLLGESDGGGPVEASTAAASAPAPKAPVKKAAPKKVIIKAEEPGAPASTATARGVKPGAAAPAVKAAPKTAEVKIIAPSSPTVSAPAGTPAAGSAAASAAKPAAAPAPAPKPSAAPKPAPQAPAAAAPKTAPAAVKAAAPAAETKPSSAPAPKAQPSTQAAPAASRPAARKARPQTPKPEKEEIPEGALRAAKRHTVAPGDTLWDLAGNYYKDPFKWGRIYNANVNQVDNPDLIEPREELVIPGIEEEIRPQAPVKDLAASLPSEDSAPADPGVTGYEVLSAGEDASASAAKTAAAKPAAAGASGNRRMFELSEEMPRDQKEWDSMLPTTVVPESWREDGEITAKSSEEDDESSLTVSGETVTLDMRSSDGVRPGDYLEVYKRGAAAFDKSGKKIGKEIQRAGMLEVLGVDGYEVKARVIDAATSIDKGLVVKKK